MCQKTDGYGNWNVRQVQCLALDRPAPSLHSSIAAKWQVGCRMCACNQHARASCLLQEPLINSQTSKTQIPNSKSGSTSGDWSDLLLHGFSLNGVWFLSSGHSLQKLPIYIYFPPPCVRCLSSWPQLESAEWWTHGHVGVLSWSQQSEGHMDTWVSWAGCPRHCAGTLKQSLVILCDFCFSRLQDSLCGVGVCCHVHFWGIVSQLFSSRELLSVVAEAIGKCGWAGVFLHVAHWVKSSEQCFFEWVMVHLDEMNCLSSGWYGASCMPSHFQLPHYWICKVMILSSDCYGETLS